MSQNDNAAEKAAEKAASNKVSVIFEVRSVPLDHAPTGTCTDVSHESGPESLAKSFCLDREPYYTDQIESIEVEPNGNDDGNSKVLADYAKSSCPVVLKGYTGKDDWTLEKIKNEVGGVFRDVRIGDYNTGQGDADSVSMQVSDFVDYLLGRSDFPQGARLVEGKGPYLANVPFPSLAEQLPISSFFPTAPENSLFWLGSESRTPLHCHQHCDVLLLQLVGRRKIVLVPPHQATFQGITTYVLPHSTHLSPIVSSFRARM